MVYTINKHNLYNDIITTPAQETQETQEAQEDILLNNMTPTYLLKISIEFIR